MSMFEGDEIDPKNFTPEAVQNNTPTSPARKTHYPHIKDTGISGIGTALADLTGIGSGSDSKEGKKVLKDDKKKEREEEKKRKEQEKELEKKKKELEKEEEKKKKEQEREEKRRLKAEKKEQKKAIKVDKKHKEIIEEEKEENAHETLTDKLFPYLVGAAGSDTNKSSEYSGLHVDEKNYEADKHHIE